MFKTFVNLVLLAASCMTTVVADDPPERGTWNSSTIFYPDDTEGGPGRSEEVGGVNATNSSSPIIGGTTALAGDFPWFVRFPSNAGCQGALVAPDRVLTSATCILTQDPATVFVGSSTTSDGLEVSVACNRVHPDYYRTSDSIFNDIAIMKLLQPVNEIAPVELNTDLNYPPEDIFAATMGFGFIDGGGPLSPTLQVADLVTVSTYDCQLAFPDGVINGNQHLCAFADGAGVCSGTLADFGLVGIEICPTILFLLTFYCCRLFVCLLGK